jgi:hypothetical protein
MEKDVGSSANEGTNLDLIDGRHFKASFPSNYGPHLLSLHAISAYSSTASSSSSLSLSLLLLRQAIVVVVILDGVATGHRCCRSCCGCGRPSSSSFLLWLWQAIIIVVLAVVATVRRRRRRSWCSCGRPSCPSRRHHHHSWSWDHRCRSHYIK